MKILTIVIVFILSMVSIWFCMDKIKVPTELVYLHTENNQIYATPTNDAIQIIAAINANYATLKTMDGDLSVVASAKITANLWGKIDFEKEKNFRMQLSSRLGAETDVGSNQQYFWFWSKRMKPSYLYYAAHQDLQRTPLKTLFHPLWMMECLGIGEIDLKGAVIYKQGSYLTVRQTRIGTMGQLAVKVTLVDIGKKVVIGHYLYDDDLKLIASSETIEFQNCGEFRIPKKIRMVWHEEGAGMELELNHVQINKIINKNTWEIPNIKKKNLVDLFPQS